MAAFAANAAGSVMATGYCRGWGSVSIGLHRDRVTDRGLAPVWHNSFALGAEGGVDVVQLQGHRVGVYAHLDAEIVSDAAYAAVTLGLAYRR